MFDKLKKYCKQTVPLTDTELDLIDGYFEERPLKKKEFLLQDTTVCNFIGFIANGSIRHFHIKNGVEKTCDISFENAWVTDFQSFTDETVGKMKICPGFSFRKESLRNEIFNLLLTNRHKTLISRIGR